MHPPIITGVVGFGISARVFHIPFLLNNPGYRLKAVVQRQGRSAAEIGATVYVTPDAMLEDPEIELVVITTPNDTHADLARIALEAGRHVVMEKPFTVDSASARALIDLAGKRNRILTVYHNRRYTSDFLTVKKVLAAGELGVLHTYEAHYDRYRLELRPGAWRETTRAGSGVFWDLGPHLLDQALCLFGAPSAIRADIRTQRPGAATDDWFHVELDYGPLLAILQGGMLVREPGPRYQLHGRYGSFLKYGDDPQEALLRAGVAPGGPEWGMEPPDQYGILHTGRRERVPSERGNYGGYYAALYRTIREGAPLLERAEHGHNAVRLIELARQSRLDGRQIPVTGLLPG